MAIPFKTNHFRLDGVLPDEICVFVRVSTLLVACALIEATGAVSPARLAPVLDALAIDAEDLQTIREGIDWDPMATDTSLMRFAATLNNTTRRWANLHCAALFWVKEAALLGTCHPGAIAAKWPKSRKVEGPTAGEFLSAIPSLDGDADKELFVRMRSWWRTNDRFRTGGADAAPFSEAERANLAAIAEALGDADPQHIIMRAEIARELGQFDQCLKLLDREFEEGVQFAVRTIRERAFDSDSRVVELK